ncbi:MAG: hypothetical protein Q4D29_13800, partial [Lachnospiraceae bacterium]|nr:hypothetical protein [Lachnospiraceae bacterium]
MYKLIDRIYLTIWMTLTVVLVFTKSPVIAYTVLGLIVSQIFIIKRTETIFEIFLLTTVAWGASLNLAYRMGSFMVSDFSLLILLLAIIIRKDVSWRLLSKKNFMVECLAAWFIIWGMAQGFAFGNVLQDFKLFLYIFVPYIYLSSVKTNADFFVRLGNVLKLYVIVVFLLEATQLASIGLSVMIANGFGNRDVAIIVQFVPVVAALMLLQKNSAISKVVFQIICFLACLLSFTRTIWITYAASIIIVCFLGENNIQKNVKNIMVTISFIIAAFLIVSYARPDLVEKYSNAIFSRLTDSTNSNNTLEHRWVQSEALLKTKVLRPMTLIGAGFGEITELKKSVFMENSVLYYLWKYGLVVTIYMVVIILHDLWMAFRSGASQLRAVSLSLLSVLVRGNFSGNLYMYYFVPARRF